MEPNPGQNQGKRPGGAMAGKDQASRSELFPFLSNLPAVLRKVYVIPGLVLLGLIVLAFTGQARPLVWLIAVAITGGCFFFIYRICGKKKPLRFLLLVFYAVFCFLGFPFTHSDPLGISYTLPPKGKSVDSGYYLGGSYTKPLFVPPGVDPVGFVGSMYYANGAERKDWLIPPGMTAQQMEMVLKLLDAQGAIIDDPEALYEELKNKAAPMGGPLLMVPFYNTIFTVERSLVFPLLGTFYAHSPGLMAVSDNLFSAGIPEEIVKSLPLFLLLFWGLKKSDEKRQVFGVTEPLDGIILGAATGAGFALAENLFLYIPRTMHGAGGITGLGLILLRSLDMLSGHIAYAGYFGYFIGLAAMRPKKRTQTVLIGFFTAALSHGLWDASGYLSPKNPLMLELVLAGASYLFLAAAVVKAREISPNRAALQGSVTVATLQRLARRQPAAPTPAPAAGPTPPRVAFETAAPAPVPVRAAPVVGAEYPASVPAPQATAALWLRIGNQRLPLAVGAKFGEPQLPGLRASSDGGAVAEVVRNPNNPSVLGLKNLSQLTWNFTLPGEQAQAVAPGRHLRLTHGARVDFGSSAGIGEVES